MDVLQELVVSRLEVLLPGLSVFAERRAAERRAARAAIVRRLRSGQDLPGVATASDALNVDIVLELAEERGLIQGRTQIDDAESTLLASLVLARLADLDETILVVSDRLVCSSVPAVALAGSLPADLAESDGLFVCTETFCVVVLHHSGWIFTIGPPTPRPGL